jgi:ABC-type nitrate/sulfonate/bicarbonate transport system permease component
VRAIVTTPGAFGYLIMQADDYLNTALVFSGIIAIAILGLTWTPACAGCSCWPTRAGGDERA